jgi:hypothetical protein
VVEEVVEEDVIVIVVAVEEVSMWNVGMLVMGS